MDSGSGLMEDRLKAVSGGVVQGAPGLCTVWLGRQGPARGLMIRREGEGLPAVTSFCHSASPIPLLQARL